MSDTSVSDDENKKGLYKKKKKESPKKISRQPNHYHLC